MQCVDGARGLDDCLAVYQWIFSIKIIQHHDYDYDQVLRDIFDITIGLRIYMILLPAWLAQYSRLSCVRNTVA